MRYDLSDGTHVKMADPRAYLDYNASAPLLDAARTAILVALDGIDQRTHPHHDASGAGDVVHNLWHDLQSQSEIFLRSVTLQTLLDRDFERLENATYVI